MVIDLISVCSTDILIQNKGDGGGGKRKKMWKNNKAILDRTIKTRGGSNKKRFTRKK